MKPIDPNLLELFNVALEARNRSYSPYSHFQVGAALRIATGQIVGGCNVENASYGGTICAERNAVLSAISQRGSREFTELLVLTDSNPPAVPCAFCLGVLGEFCPPDFSIHLANLQGVQKSYRLSELLPHPFKF